MRPDPRLSALALLLASVPSLGQSTPDTVELVFKGENCPSRAQLELALGAAGLRLGLGSAHRVIAVQTENGDIELELIVGDRSRRRTLRAQRCDAQAATMAGVIERFVRPLPSQAAPPAATPTPPDAPVASGASGENEGPGPPGSKPAPARRRPRGATREAEPASDAPPLITTGVATPSPLKPVESIQSPQVETEPDAPATAASDERLNRLGLGAGAVWFSASSARATLDARYGRQVTRWLELVAGVGWLSGFRLPVASGAVSTDELRLLLATGARPLAQVPLHLELGATLRAVSARSAGIAVARQAVVWSPAVSAGVALRVQVGWVTLEAAVRGHLFFEELRFQVDASDVLVFRRAELSVTGGAFIHF